MVMETGQNGQKSNIFTQNKLKFGDDDLVYGPSADTNEHSRKELRDKCKEKIRTKKAQGNKSQKRLAKKAKK